MKKLMIFTSTVVVIVFTISFSSTAIEQSTQNVLKDAIIGAGTGAIAAGTSGGNAGTGALIGAGTGTVGSALMDILTQPSSTSRQRSSSYRTRLRKNKRAKTHYYEEVFPSDESYTVYEIFQLGYEEGYHDGFDAGFEKAIKMLREKNNS